VRGFKEILDGKHDDVPEGNFYMKGGIEEIQSGSEDEKGKTEKPKEEKPKQESPKPTAPQPAKGGAEKKAA
jgi:hypothetical protein